MGIFGLFQYITSSLLNVCDVNLLLFFSYYNIQVFLNQLSNCLQCQKECGEREFQCYCYGFSPLLTPTRHCSHLLFTFLITFSLYLKFLKVGFDNYIKGTTCMYLSIFDDPCLPDRCISVSSVRANTFNWVFSLSYAFEPTTHEII